MVTLQRLADEPGLHASRLPMIYSQALHDLCPSEHEAGTVQQTKAATVSA
jgi:hypothetical protein